MSREILFKAKRIDNGEWVEGGYSYCAKDDTHFITQMSKDHISYIGRHQQVDPNTICQYTGLTDKNGNKIWENDVISEDWGNFKGVVRFGNFENIVLKNIGFNIDWNNAISYRQDLPYWSGKSVVIGNIFDNPELIGGAENE